MLHINFSLKWQLIKRRESSRVRPGAWIVRRWRRKTRNSATWASTSTRTPPSPPASGLSDLLDIHFVNSFSILGTSPRRRPCALTTSSSATLAALTRCSQCCHCCLLTMLDNWMIIRMIRTILIHNIFISNGVVSRRLTRGWELRSFQQSWLFTWSGLNTSSSTIAI